MAQFSLPLLQIVLPILFITATFTATTATAAATAKAKAKSPPPPKNFVKSFCAETTYPSVCMRSISAYSGIIEQSPLKMAYIALNVSLTEAQISQTKVSKLAKQRGLKPNVGKALDVCLKEMNDIIEKIKKSINELSQIGNGDKVSTAKRINNVQTLVNAAVADQCSESLKQEGIDDKTKTEVLAKASNVKKVTINALALVNKVPLNSAF